jgi:UDP-glucose 4-epimerase
MAWLITGGAGYIGAHVVRAALDAGYEIVVLDDLSTGDTHRLPENVTLEIVSTYDAIGVKKVFKNHLIQGVVHLAARKQVGESSTIPLTYWHENVDGLHNVLNAMAEKEVKNFVFSSSAAVYGIPPELGDNLYLTENMTCLPISPYGQTKLAGEWMAQALVSSDQFKVAALRYFNAAGAGNSTLGDTFKLNLIPLAFDALTTGKSPKIFGNDYNTPDGTCLRDYIHVTDLADAHIAAMNFVQTSEPCFEAINVATGLGSSVSEVLSRIEQVTEIPFSPVLLPRRAGDPDTLVADPSKALKLLGWSSRYSLEDSIVSAWDAWPNKH